MRGKTSIKPLWSCATMLTAVAVLLVHVDPVCGHGRLMEPPSRSSMWRMGFNTPKNYNDNQLYCGGLSYMWKRMKGKCGICGDPYGGRMDNEAGGRYATGKIVRTYKMGQTIEAKVDITANHKGFFTFKMCPNNNPNRRATQECLDKYPLMAVSQGSYEYRLESPRRKMFKVMLKLPDGLTCSQCVLQWDYTAGNNWGICSNGKGRVGCGPQEHFRGCADVAIVNDDGPEPDSKPTPESNQRPEKPTHKYQPVEPYRPPGINYKPDDDDDSDVRRPTYPFTTYEKPKRKQPPREHDDKPSNDKNRTNFKNRRPQENAHNPEKPVRSKKPNYITAATENRQVDVRKGTEEKKSCRAVGIWKTVPGMDNWCVINCRRRYCPPSHCTC